jgi:hypothetical protein
MEARMNRLSGKAIVVTDGPKIAPGRGDKAR